MRILNIYDTHVQTKCKSMGLAKEMKFQSQVITENSTVLSDQKDHIQRNLSTKTT